MENIAIIGAGISGLSIAQILKNRYRVILFESDSRPGGLIQCDMINGSLFHRTGGHVFNTKREDVATWFWNYFDQDMDFSKVSRNAAVLMSDDLIIPYPIENHVSYFNKNIVMHFIDDLLQLSKQSNTKAENFQDFLMNTFGRTLYDLYFGPYNHKIWKCDLSKIPLSWLEGKFPVPTVEEMIYNNISHIGEQESVHSSFYYPNKGGSQFLADQLAKGLEILYKSRIKRISPINNKWNINGFDFDKVIFCGNIKQIPDLLARQLNISAYSEDIELLKFHGTTSVFCEIKSNPYSWIYLPNSKYESHRIICSGNFSESNDPKRKMTATIEFTDYISEEDIKANLRRMPFSPIYLTHHYEKYTYPIQSAKTRLMIKSLKKYLAQNNIFLLGRFAEWEYYNMDVAIGAALDLSKLISYEKI